MNYSQAMDFLAAAPAFVDKAQQRTDMLRLLHRLGDPQRRVRAIHVAGTNGKGSVCAYLSTVLSRSGFRTGLFVSPYLVDFSERISVDGVRISRDEIAEYMDKISTAAASENARITQFAYITIMMFMYFADVSVDYAVIEVGLGGLDDPTNLCEPAVCVITSVSMDHTKILGSTLREIAWQKAGIIKAGIPVVTVPQSEDALQVISECASAVNAPLYIIAPENIKSDENGTSFSFEGTPCRVRLSGAYQADNASAALKAAILLGADTALAANAIGNAVWPGRMQVLSTEPYMLLDGAHNPDAAEKLSQYVSGLSGEKLLITGMAGDKDIPACVKAFAKFAGFVYTVNIKSPRSMDSAELLKLYNRAGIPGIACADASEALRRATARCGAGQKIIICGSLFLVGEILKMRQEVTL